MKTKIYYFTGTGNSLKIAKDVSERVENSELISIISASKQSMYKPDAEKVGFVFPLYYYGLPKIVNEFIEQIDLSDVKYCFSIVTAGFQDGIALKQLETILLKKNKALNAGFYIAMPSNYILFFNAPAKDKQDKIFAKAAKKVDEIADIINNNENRRDREHLLYKLVTNAPRSYKKWRAKELEHDAEFSVNKEKCTSCEICSKVCPTDNIKLDDGAPVWHHRCEQCLACINICPSNCILYKNKTIQKRRYKHPSISIKELAGQKNNNLF